MDEIRTGRYRHYKGKEYEVLGVARHRESAEELVLYRTCYGRYDLWGRPKTVFLETMLVDGSPAPRFAYRARARKQPVKAKKL